MLLAMELFDIFFPKYCVVCKKVGKYLCDKDIKKVRGKVVLEGL